MSIYSKAISVSASSLGTIVARLGIFAILARLISPTEFGVVAMAFAIIAIAAPIVDLDLRDALVQRATIGRRHAILALISCAFSSVIVSALVIASASLVEDAFDVAGVGSLLQVMCAILFLDSFANVGQGLLLRARREKLVGRMEVLSFLFGFGPSALTAAFFGEGIWALTVGYIGLSAFKCTYSWISVARLKHGEIFEIADEARWLEVWKDLMRHTRGGVATRLLMRASLNLDNVLVGKFLNAQALGLYSRAFNLSSLPVNQSIGLVIRTVVFPELSRRHHSDAAAARVAAIRAVELGAMLIMPFCAALAILSDEVVALLLGPDWTEAGPVLSILALGLAFRFAPRLAIALCRAMGRLAPAVWMNLLTVTLIAILVPLGALLGGLQGAAIGMTLTLTLQWLWAMRIMARALDLRMFELLKVQVRPASISIVLGALVYVCILAAEPIGHGFLPVLLLAGTVAGLSGWAALWFAPSLIWPLWIRMRLGNFLLSLDAGLPALAATLAHRLGDRYLESAREG